MSYAQRKEISGNRTAAIVIVAILHAILGYAIVTGLAYNVIKKAAEDLKTFDVEEEPPPPEETPPPPENQPDVPPPVVAPPPIVRIDSIAPPPVVATPVAPPPVITPTAPPAPPAPPAPRITKAQSTKGDVRNLFSADDYPASAQNAEAQGTAQARLDIGADGRVTNCTIIRSAGNSALDSATCSILRRRARFTPARDSAGSAIADTYTTPPIRWQLADQ